MGADPSENYELSKITKIAVFCSRNQIVFLIKISLVTEVEFTLGIYNFTDTPCSRKESTGEIDNKHSNK